MNEMVMTCIAYWIVQYFKYYIKISRINHAWKRFIDSVSDQKKIYLWNEIDNGKT